MKVLKFGGTSVGTADGLKCVKAIVESTNEQVIVVVSALSGVTDLLISTAQQAAVGDVGYSIGYARIVERHKTMIEEVIPKKRQGDVFVVADRLLKELNDIYQGVSLIRELSSRTLDLIVSYGERLSSEIVCRAINDAKHFDSRNFIKTECQIGKHIVDIELSGKLIRREFDSFVGKVALIPGFISSDKTSGDITNLGRGGSDYTAAVVAAAMSADVLEIWTDTDGFMTADPRVVKNAYAIDRLSFVEALELCNFGAKVIYPPTIYPVYQKNIPILIKNTFNAERDGTWITNECSGGEDKPIKGISSINDTCLITVSGLGMVGVIGVNSRIFSVLAENGISVFLVSQSSSEHNTSLAVRHCDADLAVKVLSTEFAKEITTGEITEITAEKNLATVAVVGENMKHTPGIAGKLFNTLGRNGINVVTCAQGASEMNISFVIRIKSLHKALNVIHDSFFLSETQVLNLFVIGVGNVGKYLLEQIRLQQANLRKNKALSLNVVGIANSKRCIFDRYGINIKNFRDKLDHSELSADPETICREIIRMNIYNSVFVDCTASQKIADLYGILLSHNVNVVAANKLAASSNYENYFYLKQTARKKDVKFLFETNVGAGLPVISTINSLINSGDRILKIEAVISGSLNFIFNVLSKDVRLSDAIQMAMDAGYSEPDPREDLSGKDVVRKLVILSREAGYKVDMGDVGKHLFIPNEYFHGDVPEFFSKIKNYDSTFEQKRADAERNQKRLRFVARFECGKAEVGLQEVSADHPFYALESSNNVILITTERYKEYPMEIKGYGAGAEVTAAGVFADIISIANIR